MRGSETAQRGLDGVRAGWGGCLRRAVGEWEGWEGVRDVGEVRAKNT